MNVVDKSLEATKDGHGEVATGIDVSSLSKVSKSNCNSEEKDYRNSCQYY